MRATIDKAGRVVIPLALRRAAGLRPGSELEVELDDAASLRLTRRVSGPKLVRVGKRLVARPTAPVKRRPEVDVAQLIDEDRSRWPV